MEKKYIVATIVQIWMRVCVCVCKIEIYNWKIMMFIVNIIKVFKILLASSSKITECYTSSRRTIDILQVGTKLCR